VVRQKNKKCVECGREDQPWFSKKRCKSCAQKAYSSKAISRQQNVNKTPRPTKPLIKRTKRDSSYKNVYFDFFGYVMGDFVPCEICGGTAVDIHHIEADGMGGNPNKDGNTIENLMALCREHHEQYGDKKQYKDFLKIVHNKRMNDNS